MIRSAQHALKSTVHTAMHAQLAAVQAMQIIACWLDVTGNNGTRADMGCEVGAPCQPTCGAKWAQEQTSMPA